MGSSEMEPEVVNDDADANENGAFAGFARALARTLQPRAIVKGIVKGRRAALRTLPKKIPIAPAKVARAADRLSMGLDTHDVLTQQQERARSVPSTPGSHKAQGQGKVGVRQFVAEQWRMGGWRAVGRSVVGPLAANSVLGTVLFGVYESTFAYLTAGSGCTTGWPQAGAGAGAGAPSASLAGAVAGGLAGACHGGLAATISRIGESANVDRCKRKILVDSVEFAVLFGAYQVGKQALLSAGTAGVGEIGSGGIDDMDDFHGGDLDDDGADARRDWAVRGMATVIAGGSAGMLQQYVSHVLDVGTGAARGWRQTIAGPGSRSLAPAALPAAIGFVALEFTNDIFDVEDEAGTADAGMRNEPEQ